MIRSIISSRYFQYGSGIVGVGLAVCLGVLLKRKYSKKSQIAPWPCRMSAPQEEPKDMSNITVTVNRKDYDVDKPLEEQLEVVATESNTKITYNGLMIGSLMYNIRKCILDLNTGTSDYELDIVSTRENTKIEKTGLTLKMIEDHMHELAMKIMATKQQIQEAVRNSL